MNHYPHHIGDFTKDTLGFSQGAIGAYRLLMDAYYANEESIAADDIYVIGRATTPAERKNVEKALAKFELREGRYYHKRIEEELTAYRERSETGRKNVAKRYQEPSKPLVDDILASSHKPVTSKPNPEASSSASSETPAPSTTAARASPPPSSFPTANDQRVTQLHGIALASGVRARILDAQQWVHDGLTEAQLLEAIGRAKSKKPEGGTVPIAFLQCFVADVRAGVGGNAPYDPDAVRAAAIARINAKEAANATH